MAELFTPTAIPALTRAARRWQFHTLRGFGDLGLWTIGGFGGLGLPRFRIWGFGKVGRRRFGHLGVQGGVLKGGGYSGILVFQGWQCRQGKHLRS